MSDYIKREDAIFVALQQPLYSVVSQIKQLEGIDIVRCKECKHREKCEQMVVFENGKYITSGYKLDYCSHGEREGE